MPFRRHISLITLDLDDTLWPCGPVIAEAEAALHAWLQREAARLAAAHDVASLRSHRMALARQRPEIAHDFTAVRLHSLRELLQQFDYAAELAEHAVTVFREARNCVTPYPDALPVLESLGERFRLVSVTNGNADVSCTPLSTCFHLCLTAAEVGAAKPSPAIFRRALERHDTPPERALHVGDDPHLDIVAAQQVGMRTAWMNRNGAAWPGDLPEPDVTVKDLHELEDWLLGT